MQWDLSIVMKNCRARWFDLLLPRQGSHTQRDPAMMELDSPEMTKSSVCPPLCVTQVNPCESNIL